jgi:quinol monooxygenase YgiN
MPDDLSTQVIQITHYSLVQSRDAFVAAIQALARRTEAEGHPGVLGYRFYANTDTQTAGAVITYADASAWLAHHQIAYQWEEMPKLQATVKLQSLALFGPLSEEVENWIQKTGISYTHYDLPAAGFVRAQQS